MHGLHVMQMCNVSIGENMERDCNFGRGSTGDSCSSEAVVLKMP